MPAQEAPTKPKPVPGQGTAESVNGPGKPPPGSTPPIAESQPAAPANSAPAPDSPSAASTEPTTRPRDVDYTIEFVDDLPGQPTSEHGRPSVFEERIADIKADPAKHKKWARLASYRNGSAGAAAANVLRQRHGEPYVEGLAVETRRVDDRTLLFVQYDPSRVEEGGKERWERVLAERKAKNAERRAARKAEESKAVPSTSAASAPTSTGAASTGTASPVAPSQPPATS